MNVRLIVGTAKGGFVIHSSDRQDWKIEGPIFKGWKVTTSARDRDGTFLVGTASDVYGSAIHRANDPLGEWKQANQSPQYPRDGGRKMNQIWRIVANGDSIYAGVDEAGLFRSTDGGDIWSPVAGLNEHATRGAWCPGAGGLCAHSILIDPTNPKRLWCGISAVGVFRSDDGGESWQAKNDGIPVILEDKDHPDIGYCVHGLVASPTDANRIYRQDHVGMFRSTDGGDHWERNEEGLPSGFGFPIAMDSQTETLFAAPQESDEYRLPKEGRLCICRSTDRGNRWEEMRDGLPTCHSYEGVLRGAMVTDHLDPCGVYFGTTSGSVYVSVDCGASWKSLPCRLPRVLCVDAYVDG